MAGLYEFNGVAPQIDPTAWIAPGAQIIGDVRIAAGATIWFNAVLRGDNEPIVIGRDVNIQDGAVLHTDMGFPLTIGEMATVGHLAMLHGCTIEPRALVGMKATILNGAVIATGCLVGAGALVTEGKSFESGALIVGAPARAARQLSEEAAANLTAAAHHYVEKRERYRTGLKPVAR